MRKELIPNLRTWCLDNELDGPKQQTESLGARLLILHQLEHLQVSKNMAHAKYISDGALPDQREISLDDENQNGFHAILQSETGNASVHVIRKSSSPSWE